MTRSAIVPGHCGQAARSCRSNRAGGALHRWDGAGPSLLTADGLTLPNGLGWNADSTEMYLTGSMTHQLLHAPFDLERGEVGDFRAFASVSEGLPDGFAVDIEGCLWVAIWGGSAVHRYDRRGRLIGVVRMPVTQPASCAFGADGTLCITSARAGLDPDALAKESLAGGVFAVRTATRGVPVASFAN